VAAIILAVIALILIFFRPGSTGANGPAGSIGSKGPVGPPGSVGTIGDQGPTGPPSVLGLTGPRGPTGNVGSTGPIGRTGFAGPQGAIGPTGTEGQLFTNQLVTINGTGNVNLGLMSSQNVILSRTGGAPNQKLILGSNNLVTQFPPWIPGTQLLINAPTGVDKIPVCSLCSDGQTNACDTTPPCLNGALFYAPNGSPYVSTLSQTTTYTHTLVNLTTPQGIRPTIFRAINSLG
jgi:hypothetical protein